MKKWQSIIAALLMIIPITACEVEGTSDQKEVTQENPKHIA